METLYVLTKDHGHLLVVCVKHGHSVTVGEIVNGRLSLNSLATDSMAFIRDHLCRWQNRQVQDAADELLEAKRLLQVVEAV